MGLEQVNQQQMAVLGNLSAAQNVDQILKSEMERKTDTANSSKIEESLIKKVLNGKAHDVGVQILAGLANKLAHQVGQAKLMDTLTKEYGFVEGQQENSQDQFDINNPITRIGQAKQQSGQQTGSGLNQDEEGDPQQTRSDIKEYIGAYSQTLVNGGQEAKRKMEQLEAKLLAEHGANLKDLKSLKLQVANSIRSDIANQVKDAYLKEILSKSRSMEWLVAHQTSNSIAKFAAGNERLGGLDFGGYQGNLQGVLDTARDDTHQLLRDFVDDALTGEIIKKVVSDDADKTAKDIDDLLKLGAKVGLDLNNFTEKLPRIADNLGLTPVFINTSGAGAGANSDQQPRHQYQYTYQEEKDILTDKLRALYMRRAVYGDNRTLLETQFKMIKTKNGLIKLGVSNFDQVEKEAAACAKIKLFDMLREGFEERATYAKLEGPAWQMTERKLKTVLRNLEKIGVALGQIELDQLRDRANEKMFQEAEHEYSLISAALESQGEMAYLTSKRKLINGVLERLAGESGFQAPGHEIELSVREAC
jgi:hypothetical protein